MVVLIDTSEPDDSIKEPSQIYNEFKFMNIELAISIDEAPLVSMQLYKTNASGWYPALLMNELIITSRLTLGRSKLNIEFYMYKESIQSESILCVCKMVELT